MARDRQITYLITGFGMLLILIGVGAYFITDSSSITALIPAFIGLPMLVAGWVTNNPKFRTWGIIGALVLTLAMIGGSFRGINAFISGITGNGSISGPAWLQVGLVVLSLLFLVSVLGSAFSRRKVRL